jgi:hypothetical protein
MFDRLKFWRARWLRKLVGAEYGTVAEVHAAYYQHHITIDQVRLWYVAEGYTFHETELCCKWLELLRFAKEELHA